MTNFFQSPQIMPVSNYEPPGYSALRNSLMNQIGARQMNPFGLNNGPQGGSQYDPYQGRPTFDPYSGGYSGGYGGNSPSYNPGGGGGYGNPWGGGGQQMGQQGGAPMYSGGGGMQQYGGGQQAPPMSESPNQVGPSSAYQNWGSSAGESSPSTGAYQPGHSMPGGQVSSQPGNVQSPQTSAPAMQALMQQLGQGGQKSTGGSPQANVMQNPQVGGAAPQGPIGGPPSAANNYGGVGYSAYNIFQQQQGQNPQAPVQPPMQGSTGSSVQAQTQMGPGGIGTGPHFDDNSGPIPGGGPPQKDTQPGPAQLGFDTNATQANVNAPQNTHPGGTSMMSMPEIAQMIQGQPNTSNPGAAQLAQPYRPNAPQQVRYGSQQFDGIPGNPGGTPTGGTGGPAYTGPSWSQSGGGQDAAQAGVDARQAMANSGAPGRQFIEGSQTGATPPPGAGGNIGAQGTVGSFDFNSPRTQYDATPASTAGSTDPSLIAKLMALLHLATGGSAAPQAPAVRPPMPTPTPPPIVNPNPQNTTKGGTNLNTIQQRADDIANNNDGIKYDGSDPQPYPDESSPQPYDGSPMSGGVMSGAGMHIHAPMAQVHPQGVPSAGPPGLNKILGGMASANRHGQMAAYRAGKPGVVYDAGNPIPGQAGGAAPSPSTSSSSTPQSGYASAMPTSAQTAGASMYPWMQSYQGNFTAPMSGAQNQGLSGQQGFAGSNPLAAAGNYNQQLLSGAFMPENNANIQQIQQGMAGTKAQQDADAQQQIASSMAAGGNALSGARLAANAKYMDQSNNNYNTLMGNLQYNNLQNEQALRNQGVGQAEGLTNTQTGLNQSLMNMGAVPQQLAQRNDTAQYNDWLRQIGAMQQGDQQNTTNAMNLLKTNPGGQAPQYGTSQASSTAALLSSLLGGSGQNGGVLSSLLKALGIGGTPASSGAKTPGSGGGGGSPSLGSSNLKPGENGAPPTDAQGNELQPVGQDGNGTAVYSDGMGGYFYQDGTPAQSAPYPTGSDLQYNNEGDQNMQPNWGDQNMIDPNAGIDTSGGLDSGGGDYSDEGI